MPAATNNLSPARILTALTAVVVVCFFALATALPMAAKSADDRIKTMDKFFKVEKGESLTWRCTLRNETEKTLQFDLRVMVILKNGKTSDSEAMMKELALNGGQVKEFGGSIKMERTEAGQVSSISLNFEKLMEKSTPK